MTTETNHAEQQAYAQLESINLMIQRLDHVQDCNWDPDNCECDITAKEITETIDEYNRELYHDQDDAQQRIDEDPLSVCLRSGWTPIGDDMEAEEYEILLCTGGPAVRIVGQLNNDGTPANATLEYQDWGIPWTYYTMSGTVEGVNLLAYAEHFIFEA